MKISNFIIRLMGAVAMMAFMYSCSDDEVAKPDVEYGFVQFKLQKSGLDVNTEAATRAGNTDMLDSLADAKKLKVTLKSAYDVVEQTLALVAPNAQDPERGLWSEKFRLLSGNYIVSGYEILDNLGNSILTYDVEEEIPFEVFPGGMTVHPLGVNVRPRGTVKFHFVKDLSQIVTRAGSDAYTLQQVAKADIRLEHQETGEIHWINNVRTKLVYFYESGDKGEPLHSRLECDTVVPLKVGHYTATSFSLYSKADKVLEAGVVPADNGFEVNNAKESIAKVPITMQATAGHISDGIILKKIWEALDGPNWSYRGSLYNKGVNWEFNRDVDLWTIQPGVTLDANGRVVAITFGGFGARGDIPEELGELDMLRSLSVGYFDETPASSPINQKDADMIVPAARDLLERMSEADYCLLDADPAMREEQSEEIKARLKRAEESSRFSPKALDAAANDPNNYSTAITSLPKSIAKLTNLKSLFICYSPITDAGLPDELGQLPNCTDVQIYACPNLTNIPKGLMDMPQLTMVMFANTKGVSAEKLYEGLQYWNTKEKAKRDKPTLQGLIMVNNNLKRVPDLTGMKKLSVLNCANNQIEEIEVAFGKSHYLRTINMMNNRLKDLPRAVAEDGKEYFADYWGSETWSFSYNQFTSVPNVFGADAKITTLDFSCNQISELEGGEDFRGVRAEILNFGYNNFEKFPENLYSTGSYMNYLIIRGNGMREFRDEALKGEYVYVTTTMDLGDNRLKKLPDDFNAITFPYMKAMDMSGNAFEEYCWRAMNLPNLQTFIFRAQRDDRGFRCMKEWPSGIYAHHGMRVLLLGSNDIRKVEDSKLSSIRFYVDLTDNPNLVIDLTDACPYVKNGSVYFALSPGQDVRGCDIINPNK